MRKKEIFKKKIFQCLGVAATLVLAQSCTDLEPNFGDSTRIESTSGEFSGVSDPDGALTNLYTGIENLNAQQNEYALMEVSAENIAVLTRGADWGDNGVWRLLHNHNWSAGHLDVLNSWNRRNQEVFNATQLIDPASTKTPSVLAQAQVIRAMNMFMVVSFYGVAPFREVNDGADVFPAVLSAQEAYDFILNDINAAIDSGNLSNRGPSVDDADRFTIGEAVARFVRAKINLNAERILGTAPNGAYQAVIDDIDAIEDLGYSLDESDNYYDIWSPAENSEVLLHLNTGTGERVWNQLHPNQGGWNGFVTLTETFRLFGTDDESQDSRLGVPGPEVNGVSVGYLRGQQKDGTGADLTDRQDNPLVFEDELLTSLEINNERNGIRIVKYPQRGEDGRPAPINNFVFIRFSEAVLMRAEASLRNGGGGNPTADINLIRERAGATTIGDATLQDVYDEYRREMNAESNITGQRERQIRFGTFADTWELKENQDEFRKLFPIPQNALANPNLVQNEGY
ncbi:RagB/SusD family nutrient uptake outer membrane protein [Flagellimonas sp. 389]|uniref:RagB/SusD family nutrient uptake outer membrane protein n=1 Tax=Flagellimonas sp. 389 TaxID=2835862 RepID=UPI001BD6C5BF|nr:RagB/SusD family nutrient uptake outer membrane protein [Flagellimonas sp. 389]MBS9463983.1 RagB/SusD family nutrient uptake outer membrane protein [Flagellimonas sp. 389]